MPIARCRTRARCRCMPHCPMLNRPAYNLVVKVLLAHGANPNRATIPGIETGSFIARCRTKGETHSTGRRRSAPPSAIQLLLDAGAVIDVQDCPRRDAVIVGELARTTGGDLAPTLLRSLQNIVDRRGPLHPGIMVQVGAAWMPVCGESAYLKTMRKFLRRCWPLLKAALVSPCCSASATSSPICSARWGRRPGRSTCRLRGWPARRCFISARSLVGARSGHGCCAARASRSPGVPRPALTLSANR